MISAASVSEYGIKGEKQGGSEMIHLKACKRCGGDMLVENYLGDQDLVCIQCGYRTPANPSALVLTR